MTLDKSTFKRPIIVVILTVLVLALIVAFGTCRAEAGTITTTWQPVPGADGYRIYGVEVGGSGAFTEDVGSATTHTLAGAADCVQYELTVKAYDANGEGKPAGPLLAYTVPTVTDVVGGPFAVGVKHTDVRIEGTGFAPGSVVTIDGATIHDTRRVNCSAIDIDVTFDPTVLSDRDVTVLSEPANRIGVLYPDALSVQLVVLVAPGGFGRTEVIP